MGIQKNQRGFGAVEALLIVIIIGIIGGSGWYVMKANKNINSSNADTVKSSLVTPNMKKKAATQSTASNAGNLTIKEWGVKFAISDEAPYYKFDAENDSSNSTVNIYSDKYNNLINAKGVTCKNADDNDGKSPPSRLRRVMYIRRNTLAEVAAHKDDMSYYQYVKEKTTIGNYEYVSGYAAHYVPGCALAGGDTTNLDSKIVAADRQVSDSLIAEFKSIQAN